MENTPNIRFKGFTDHWEERKLSEIAELTSSKRVHAEVYVDEGVPFYRGKEITELREHKTVSEVLYISEESYMDMVGKYGSPQINDLLITAVGTIGNTWVVNQTPFYFKDGNLIWFKNIKCNSNYLDCVLNSVDGQKKVLESASGSNQKALTMVKLNELEFMFPSKKEQQEIATYFFNLDNLITLHQRKCDETKELKKYMLQKMFPKDGEKIPEIRFKGFTDDWEQRKLEDVVVFLDTKRKPLEGAKRIPGPYPYYGASGIVDYVEGYLFDEELVLLSEDGANITDRNYPVCFLASGKYWVNNHAHVLKTKKNNENNFICNSLERKDYKQYNTGMAMPKLNQEVCRSIPVMCPSFDEQKEIGDFFRELDKSITLHQRKCDELKEVKKYMLHNMFPQKG
jgi:type I restriction enzyme, S subunit